MEKTFKKVDYSEYKDKYDEEIKTKMKTAPESIDVETMRANLYGYTFTKRYAEGLIPDEFSMDYWEEMHLDDDMKDLDLLDDLDHLLEDEKDSPYFVVRFFGLQLVRQSVVNRIDCLELKNFRGNIEKVYFDISRRFEVDSSK